MKKSLIGGAIIAFAAWFILKNKSTDAASPAAWGLKQRAGGGLDSLRGRAKQAVGNATGDDSMAAEGLVNQALGAVRTGVGKAASAVTDVLHS